MIPINAIGTYKFFVLEHSVNQTANGFPQLAAKLVVSGYYNEEIGKWEHTYLDANGNEHKWLDADMQTMMYLVLFNAEKALLNHEQVMSAFGWDGQSFSDLNGMDLSKTEFLGQVRENDYNGNITLRVEWIDHADADPVRSLKQLTPEALRALDGQYRGMLPGKVAVPVKAPAKAPTPAVPPKPAPPAPIPAPTVKPAPTTAVPSMEVPTGTTQPENETGPPTTTKSRGRPKGGKNRKPPVADQPFGVAGMTKLEAWQKVAELKAANVTDEHLNDAWIESVVVTAGDPKVAEDDRLASIDEDKITAEQWRDIASETLDKIPHNKF